MALKKLPSWFLLMFFVSGCDLAGLQSPLGSPVYPPPNAAGTSGAQSGSTGQPVSQPQPQPQPQISSSQRVAYVWQRAFEGMTLGSMAGLYGAGGGFVIGLLAGILTADSHYAGITNQIQTEQTKDKDLEAKIEQELQRQRELESQVAQSMGTASQPPPAGPSQPAQSVNGQSVNGQKVTTVAAKEPAAPAQKPAPESTVVASVSKKETAPNSPASPFRNVEVRDINGDGIPDLWIYHNPLKPSEIVRQEEATHGDGRVDSWTYFKNGKMVRREVDTKGKGTADTVYYYENEQIVREERDENGSGFVSFRAFYQNGRRAKVEEDSGGTGKIDHWIYYDTSRDGDVMVKEERDLNGDGVADVWSYYENGRLVRRDVSAVGLEILSQQDQLPSSPPAEVKQSAGPEVVKEDKGRI